MAIKIKNQKEIDALYNELNEAFVYTIEKNGEDIIGYCQFETDNCPTGRCEECGWFFPLLKVEK